MQLNDLCLPDGEKVDIKISDGLITSVAKEGSAQADVDLQLNFDGATIIPGLINSHDHLDFNLFPAFGNRKYANYRQWGPYINLRYKPQIDAILKIPYQLRRQWGIYKNLLAGVTTVAEHGDKLMCDSPLIGFVHKQQCLHSAGFEKFWKMKLNDPRKLKLPGVLHVGEGIDNLAHQEVSSVINWNFLKRKLIAIHGVAMDTGQAAHYSALVWCPASNYFLFNKTADIKALKRMVPILFGTDSTLTSGWNIWQHLRDARAAGQLHDDELFASVTTAPALAWQLNAGMIAPGKDADLVVIKPRVNIFDTDSRDILLVMRRGEIILFDEHYYNSLAQRSYNLTDFDRVKIDGSYKFVRGGVVALMEQIRSYYPEAVFPIEAALNYNYA